MRKVLVLALWMLGGCGDSECEGASCRQLDAAVPFDGATPRDGGGNPATVRIAWVPEPDGVYQLDAGLGIVVTAYPEDRSRQATLDSLGAGLELQAWPYNEVLAARTSLDASVEAPARQIVVDPARPLEPGEYELTLRPSSLMVDPVNGGVGNALESRFYVLMPSPVRRVFPCYVGGVLQKIVAEFNQPVRSTAPRVRYDWGDVLGIECLASPLGETAWAVECGGMPNGPAVMRFEGFTNAAGEPLPVMEQLYARSASAAACAPYVR